MSARATAAAATQQRILEAAIVHFGDRLYDEVSLAAVAAEAGVTVQTVLRRFRSKEGLAAAATALGLEAVRRARWLAPVGDLPSAMRNLVEHYEVWGARSLRFLAQEQRTPPMKQLTDAGRALHHDWVDHVFSPWLTRQRGAARARLRARLIAATDVYVWKIVRHDLGFDAKATRVTLQELVTAIVR